jgi:AraC-like DNA-binding protein
VSEVQTYVEHAPHPALAGRVRTVWTQSTDSAGHTQRHLPTGGMEIRCILGSAPQLVGPLSVAFVEVLPPHTVTIGMRFRPGGATPLLGRVPAGDVLDEAPDLTELRRGWGTEVGEALALAPSPEAALALLQRFVLEALRDAAPADRLVADAVGMLMPGRTTEVADVARSLSISRSQLRRRCVATLGVGPKTLQRTLRFQAYLALAQAAAQDALRLGDRRTASLAAIAGYADQPHLVRECGRLAGVSPTELLGRDDDRCGCGHDHAASFRSILPGNLLAPEAGTRHSFKPEPVPAS